MAGKQIRDWEAGEELGMLWRYAGEGKAHPVWLRSPHIPWEHVGPKKSMEKGEDGTGRQGLKQATQIRSWMSAEGRGSTGYYMEVCRGRDSTPCLDQECTQTLLYGWGWV